MVRYRLDMDLDFSYTDESGTVLRGSARAAGSSDAAPLDAVDPVLSGREPSLDHIRPRARAVAER